MPPTYDSQFAVIVLHINTITNSKPKPNPNFNLNCATVNKKHDVVYFLSRPVMISVPVDLTGLNVPINTL